MQRHPMNLEAVTAMKRVPKWYREYLWFMVCAAVMISFLIGFGVGILIGWHHG